MNILLVDDDRETQRLMGALLTGWGASVRCVGDGQEALDTLRAGPVPDLVMLDLMLPNISGSEVLRQMNADPLLSTVPVVIVSAFGAAGLIPEARQVVAIIGKPVNVDWLERVVNMYRNRPRQTEELPKDSGT